MKVQPEPRNSKKGQNYMNILLYLYIYTEYRFIYLHTDTISDRLFIDDIFKLQNLCHRSYKTVGKVVFDKHCLRLSCPWPLKCFLDH